MPEQPPATAVVRAARRDRSDTVSRRSILRCGFFAGLGLSAAGTGITLWNFAWPRTTEAFGGPVSVPKERVPPPGSDPVRILEGKFWLVHLKPEEGVFRDFGEAGEGGLLALYQKCPHLGCTVPWRPTYVLEGVESWFRCPCHGSTYTKAGIRVRGPAPRPMDTMALRVEPDGSLVVETGDITAGGPDNPRRAVPYRPAQARAR